MSKDATKVHTLNLTNGALFVLYQVTKDVKWYTEMLDFANACAICKLIEKRVPDLKQLKELPEKDHEGWLATPKILKLSESMRDTAKKAVESHIKGGAFSADTGNGASLLISELGLQAIPSIEHLLADDEPAEAATKKVAAAQG